MLELCGVSENDDEKKCLSLPCLCLMVWRSLWVSERDQKVCVCRSFLNDPVGSFTFNARSGTLFRVGHRHVTSSKLHWEDTRTNEFWTTVYRYYHDRKVEGTGIRIHIKVNDRRKISLSK